jgi:hypothetical protein
MSGSRWEPIGEPSHSDSLPVSAVAEDGPMWYALLFDPAKLTDAYAAGLADVVTTLATAS